MRLLHCNSEQFCRLTNGTEASSAIWLHVRWFRKQAGATAKCRTYCTTVTGHDLLRICLRHDKPSWSTSPELLPGIVDVLHNWQIPSAWQILPRSRWNLFLDVYRFSDQSSSFCTRQTYLDSLKEWICIHIFMRMTHRSMDSALLMKLLLFSSAPSLVSPKHQSGWRWTACNWSLQSLNSCGVRHLASRIVYLTLHSTLAVISYNQCDVFETSEFS